MQVQKMPLNTVNSYSKPTTTTTYVFNTMFRDDFFNSESNSCSFTLPKKLKNVMSMNLSALQYPNVASTFSDGKGTNVIYVAEDTTQLQGLVVLPSGNYEVNDFVATLQASINAQLGSENRFQVAVNPRTNRITVSNTQYTFNMNLIEKVGTSFRWSYTAANVINTPKRTTDFYQDYVYVELNDFTGSQFESTVGMLPTGTVNKNILAVVPIVSAKLTTNFDSNANFIQKTRTYSAPVNISKVSVRIVGPVGELVDLKHCDYVFCLEITTVFDNVLPYVA
jgi:hypothetical protein